MIFFVQSLLFMIKISQPARENLLPIIEFYCKWRDLKCKIYILSNLTHILI